MRLLKRYLIRQFCIWLVITLVAFIALFIVANLVENLAKFIDRQLTTLSVIQYYIFYIPYILVLMLPVAMLLSTLFSVGGLARNNEIAAMKASGISLYQLFRPLLGFGILVSIFALLFSETIVPVTNQLKEQVKEARAKRLSRADRANVFLQDIKGQIIFVRRYNAKDKSARDVSIQKYRGSSLVKRIDARRMAWRNGGWELEDGKIREFTAEQQRESSFTNLRDEEITLTPADLAREQKKPEEMGYLQLRNYIHRAERIGYDVTRWLVDLYLKLSFPFANFVVVLFGAFLSSTMRRTGKAMGFGLSLLICFLYYTFINTGQALGRNGTLHPIAAAWMGNAVFGTLGVLLAIKVQK